MIRRTVDDISTGSDSDYSNSWISWFLSSKGNEYFCEVEEDYILDRFNLTARGLAKMVRPPLHTPLPSRSSHALLQLEKYKRGDFGRCPRVLCQQQPLLPVGLTDTPYEKSVKLYCGRCEDIYSPKSSRHGSIDGAYFGTSFPHLLFLVYPGLIPPKSGAVEFAPLTRGTDEGSRRSRKIREEEPPADLGSEGMSTASVALKADRYRPRIFGFQVNEIAKLMRWQEAVRDRQVTRLELLEEHGLM
ncbi:casein kinase II, regulatory subunit [Fomitopsis serialis]|uniref:casein kinase II, regulatory subunit n=1 Tax=Fomitopsis serialis TaxID=139415 RepID=UPI002007855E|nr:casein kinase II, regulatory subunit [Neoantrodia serialis]KAH9930066.1 casein kinase II, regulatory subunit [Neoantrodia serialis]